MGYFHNELIEEAGNYLLSILEEKGSVNFDFFYDGSYERSLELCKEIGLEENQDEIVPILFDLACWQLEDAGILKTGKLKSKLADGELNYSITISAKGKRFLAGNRTFEFTGMDL